MPGRKTKKETFVPSDIKEDDDERSTVEMLCMHLVPLIADVQKQKLTGEQKRQHVVNALIGLGVDPIYVDTIKTLINLIVAVAKDKKLHESFRRTCGSCFK
jgi:hypothetical protein